MALARSAAALQLTRADHRGNRRAFNPTQAASPNGQLTMRIRWRLDASPAHVIKSGPGLDLLAHDEVRPLFQVIGIKSG